MQCKIPLNLRNLHVRNLCMWEIISLLPIHRVARLTGFVIACGYAISDPSPMI